jgi:tRNA pseudouridine55 synthase
VSTTEATGVLNVRKEPGWTSHDVVARVRRLADQKRVGHAGTLDPLAEGVLPVLLGRATRLAEAIHSGVKCYEADIRLGQATSTDDAEGEVTHIAAIPDLDQTRIEAALARFRGTISQTPPAYSAIKVQGQRAYAMARRGDTPDLQPRQVTVRELRLLGCTADGLSIEVVCSRGTYVRALARDLAVALGTVGHLSRLVRTRVGPFDLAEALTLDQIAERGVASVLLSPEVALPETPVYQASAPEASRLAHGQAITAPGLQGERVRVHDPGGRLLCVGAATEGVLRSRIWLAA